MANTMSDFIRDTSKKPSYNRSYTLAGKGNIITSAKADSNLQTSSPDKCIYCIENEYFKEIKVSNYKFKKCECRNRRDSIKEQSLNVRIKSKNHSFNISDLNESTNSTNLINISLDHSMTLPNKAKSNPMLMEDSILNESQQNLNETFGGFSSTNNSTSMLQFSEIERIKAKYANYVPMKHTQKIFTNSLDEFNNIITRAKFAKARARRISIERSSLSRNDERLKAESILETNGRRMNASDMNQQIVKLSNDNQITRNDITEELCKGKHFYINFIYGML